MSAEPIGWLATAVIVASFFFADPITLRKVQIVGALLWTAYGIIIGALPVVVANVLVFAAATSTVVLRAMNRRQELPGPELPGSQQRDSP